jgi:Tol biopolymer transport system component
VVVLVFATVAPADAAPSPYLGTIAFESDRLGPPGVMSLFGMRPDGTGVRPLGSPVGSSDASWSPDGRRIAFNADPAGVGNPDIFVMNADGSGLRQLTNGPQLDIWPDWVRGSEQIVFVSDRTGVPNIWIMNADGSDQHQVTHLGAASFGPSWTPDGRKIIFSSNHHTDPKLGNFDLFLINPDGSGLEQVTTASTFDGFPMFSPDGKKIVWASNRHDANPHETNIFIADWVN